MGELVASQRIVAQHYRDARMELQFFHDTPCKCYLILKNATERNALKKPRRMEYTDLAVSWSRLSDERIKTLMLEGLKKVYVQIDGVLLPKQQQKLEAEKLQLNQEISELRQENETLLSEVETLKAKPRRKRKPKLPGEHLPCDEQNSDQASVTGILVYAGPTDEDAFVLDVLEIDGKVRRIKGLSLATAMLDSGVTLCDPITIIQGEIQKVRVRESLGDSHKVGSALYQTWVIEKEKLDEQTANPR